MYKLEENEIKEKIEQLDIEIKQLETIIFDYKKSSNIFGFIAKILIIISGGVFIFMQTISERKAFITILVLTVAATAASLSDNNMAKKQEKKRKNLYDEKSNLEQMLEKTYKKL